MSGGPDVAKLELWRRRLREFDEGSATVREFCHQVGVSKATFYQWRHKLALVSAEPKSPPVARCGNAVSPVSFLPVQLAAQARSMAELLLSNGTRVLVPSGDGGALRAVIEAAASLPAQEGSC